jgi:hypothetical protein
MNRSNSGLAAGRYTSGLWIGGRPGSGSMSGCKPLPTTANTTKVAPDQTTGRQRGDSSRPVGKYKGRKHATIATAPKYGRNRNDAYRPPGRNPGAVTSAYRA